MTRSRFLAARCLSLAVLLGSAATLSAQAIEPPRAPNLPDEGGFGTADDQITFIGANEFHAGSSGEIETTYFINNGTRWPVSGTNGRALMLATLNGRIPEGAVVNQMCVYGEDTTPVVGANLIVTYVRNQVDAGTGLNPVAFSAATAASFSSPGDFVECVNTSIRVRSQYDIDSDGTVELIDHNLFAEFGDNRDIFGGDVRIRGVSLRWRRSLSPAPGVATFADVPTGHPYFQFVEALVASGITAGCGGGNYCVNTPITRGEMAVFLAVALGLHWPAI